MPHRQSLHVLFDIRKNEVSDALAEKGRHNSVSAGIPHQIAAANQGKRAACIVLLISIYGNFRCCSCQNRADMASSCITTFSNTAIS